MVSLPEFESGPLRPKRSTLPGYATERMEQGKGIEPSSSEWKSEIIPLYEPCFLVRMTGLEPARSFEPGLLRTGSLPISSHPH